MASVTTFIAYIWSSRFRQTSKLEIFNFTAWLVRHFVLWIWQISEITSLHKQCILFKSGERLKPRIWRDQTDPRDSISNALMPSASFTINTPPGKFSFHPSLIPALSLVLISWDDGDTLVYDGKTAQRASHYLAEPPCVSFPLCCQAPRLPRVSNKLLNSVPHPCRDPTWTWPASLSPWECFIRFTPDENLI